MSPTSQVHVVAVNVSHKPGPCGSSKCLPQVTYSMWWIAWISHMSSFTHNCLLKSQMYIVWRINVTNRYWTYLRQLIRWSRYFTLILPHQKSLSLVTPIQTIGSTDLIFIQRLWFPTLIKALFLNKCIQRFICIYLYMYDQNIFGAIFRTHSSVMADTDMVVEWQTRA